MEGFSVLRAAELAGVPAVEVRTISNRPEDADRGLWRIEDALVRLGQIVPPLVEEMRACVRWFGFTPCRTMRSPFMRSSTGSSRAPFLVGDLLDIEELNRRARSGGSS